MENFWDYSVWGSFIVIMVLLVSLMLGHMLKRNVKFLQASLIPTSVLSGVMLIVIELIYKLITGRGMFEEPVFGGNGTQMLETITYHCLALGFIASTLKTSEGKLTKKRTVEIFNTGVTTVATYLLQAVLGFGITLIIAYFIKDFFAPAGVLLPFGYGQGTGQAMNYGNIYESQYGFVGGKSFGLSVAALGFLSASIGGVIYLNILRRRNKKYDVKATERKLTAEEVQGENEIPMQGSLDKITIQMAFIAIVYLLTYIAMYGLGLVLPGMKAVVYGFNFLLGVIVASVVKWVVNFFHNRNIIHREYTSNFLLTRLSNFFFDIMVVAGVAAIRLNTLKEYWWVLLILGLVGAFSTFFYNKFVADTLFEEYKEEQFVTMYGMLTGTASTGVILLREIDGDFKTPASDNMVYQNFPAIVFGFPLMLLATLAPVKPILTMIILVVFFIVMNIILFRSKIFKKRKK